jgi:hypothetical protein
VVAGLIGLALAALAAIVVILFARQSHGRHV